MNCLYENLGTLETERFISFVIREKFDYTKWRSNLFGRATVHGINEEAAGYMSKNPFQAKRNLKKFD